MQDQTAYYLADVLHGLTGAINKLSRKLDNEPQNTDETICPECGLGDITVDPIQRNNGEIQWIHECSNCGYPVKVTTR